MSSGFSEIQGGQWKGKKTTTKDVEDIFNCAHLLEYYIATKTHKRSYMRENGTSLLMLSPPDSRISDIRNEQGESQHQRDII